MVKITLLTRDTWLNLGLENSNFKETRRTYPDSALSVIDAVRSQFSCVPDVIDSTEDQVSCSSSAVARVRRGNSHTYGWQIGGGTFLPRPDPQALPTLREPSRGCYVTITLHHW